MSKIIKDERIDKVMNIIEKAIDNINNMRYVAGYSEDLYLKGIVSDLRRIEIDLMKDKSTG